MTKLARQLGDRTGDDFIADLFLPKWFVPLMPRICGALAFGGLALVVVRLFI